MSFRPEESLSLSLVAQALVKHKKKIFIWTLVMMASAVAFIKFGPRKYLSEAKLFVRMGRESVTLDPTATTGQTLQVQETRENQINSTRDMLTSRLLLENVVDAVGADAIIDDSADEIPGLSKSKKTQSGAQTALSWVSLFPRSSPREQAIEKLAKSISVKVGKSSSVIDFGCQSGDPRLSQKILQAFLNAYREQHRLANRTDGTLAFFETQVSRIKEQLDVAAIRLRDAKNESGLVMLSSQQEMLQQQLRDLENEAFTTESALAASLASIESLRAALGKLPQQVPTESTAGIANNAADLIHHDYYQLRVQLKELESRLGEDHPKLKELREQVRQAEAILGATAPDRTQLTVGLHPTRQPLELDLRREEANADSLRAKSATIKGQLASLESRARQLNEHELEIAMLQRQIEIDELSYRSYMDHMEQARITDALDAERITNVNVVQPPTFVDKPVSPRPAMILANGLLLAMIGGLGIALGAEYLGGSPKPAREAAAELNLGALLPAAPAHGAAVN